MPSGSDAWLPRGSFRAGIPNRTKPTIPLAAISRASFARDSRVCCAWPGIDGMGCGSLMPSFTNSGAIR